MNPTSVSLLDRLRSARPDDPEWLRLEEIYRPLIRRWLGRVPGLGDEASDLTQEVFLVMVREIASFERKREGSFRAWVRQVTVNVLRNHRKRQLRRPAVGLGDYDDFLWPRSWD
jgi:RNA polymerase sigma-70 factor, ECF subfamily